MSCLLYTSTLVPLVLLNPNQVSLTQPRKSLPGAKGQIVFSVGEAAPLIPGHIESRSEREIMNVPYLVDSFPHKIMIIHFSLSIV